MKETESHPLATTGRVFVTSDHHFGQADAPARYDRDHRDVAAMNTDYVDKIGRAHV